MNSLRLHTLLIGVITEIKSDGKMQLTRVYPAAKKKYKEMRGLPRNATAKKVLEDIREVYELNGMQEKFEKTIKRFDIGEKIQ